MIGLLLWMMMHQEPVQIIPESCMVSGVTGAREGCGIQTNPGAVSGGASNAIRFIPTKLPEPVDVPAIQEAKPVYKKTMAECPSGKGLGSDKYQYLCLPLPQWTCTDKSRILLTSEDGQKHCIKF